MNKSFLLTGLIAAISVISCTSSKEKKETESHLRVTTPLKIDTSIISEYVCQIKSIRHIDLRAMERGYLQKIYVDEGQSVKAGQLLFEIMPKLYEAEVRKAAAEVKSASIEYQNTKRLADSNIVAPNELAMAKAKVDKANADLSLANVHLQFTRIRAPFDGIIDRFQVRLGSVVEEGELLSTLSDNSSMWVYFNVTEADYLDLKNKGRADNGEVKLLMANNQMFEYPGVVSAIEADFNNETGNIPFRATFPNPKGMLRHGETGSIRMETFLKDALLIPQKASFEILDKKYVYVIAKDNRVKQREITVGAEMEDLFAITAGLAEDEKILLEGLRKVKENDKITYKMEEPRAVMSRLKLPAQ